MWTSGSLGIQSTHLTEFIPNLVSYRPIHCVLQQPVKPQKFGCETSEQMIFDKKLTFSPACLFARRKNLPWVIRGGVPNPKF